MKPVNRNMETGRGNMEPGFRERVGALEKSEAEKLCTDRGVGAMACG